MKVLPLVAEEGLVLLMRNFQCIYADNLHEDRVDTMIQPMNNEFNPTLACHVHAVTVSAQVLSSFGRQCIGKQKVGCIQIRKS